MSSQNLEVQRDGLKVGWNLMAIMASVGLAMYVTFVISPLKKDIEILTKTSANIKFKLDKMDYSHIEKWLEVSQHITESKLVDKNIQKDIKQLIMDVSHLRDISYEK